MNNLLKLSAIPAVLLLAGCPSTPKSDVSLITTPTVSIPMVDGFSESDIQYSSNNVIVAPGLKQGISAEYQQKFADAVTKLVTSAGSEVVDRNLASRFIDEIHLKESMSDDDFTPYEGPLDAKYVVIPTLTNVTYSGEYQKARTSSSDGKTYHHPAECDYKGNIQATIDIRELPSMKRLTTVDLNNSETASIENPPRRSCDDENIVRGVLRNAAVGALTKGTDNYMTLTKFLGAQGVVTGAKRYDNKLYFETNLGRTSGAKPGDKVKVYMEIEGELAEVASGTLLDDKNVLQKKSYFLVDEDAQSASVKRGMKVMLSGDCTGLACTKAWIKDLSM